MVKDKARVRARIAALFPKAAHMAQKRIDAIADRLEATDDSTDDDIDEELTTINDSGIATFEEIVRTDDQLAASQKKKEPKKQVKQEEFEEDQDDLDDADLPPAVRKRLEKLENLIQQAEQKSSKEALTAKFKNDPRLKDVPAFMLNRSIPASEEDFEDAVTSLSEEYKEFAIQHNLSTIDNDAPPAGDTKPGKKNVVKEASDDEIAKLTGHIL